MSALNSHTFVFFFQSAFNLGVSSQTLILFKKRQLYIIFSSALKWSILMHFEKKMYRAQSKFLKLLLLFLLRSMGHQQENLKKKCLLFWIAIAQWTTKFRSSFRFVVKISHQLRRVTIICLFFLFVCFFIILWTVYFIINIFIQYSFNLIHFLKINAKSAFWNAFYEVVNLTAVHVTTLLFTSK